MIKVIGWSEDDAKWVRNRIETGLELLGRRHRPLVRHKSDKTARIKLKVSMEE